MKYLFVAVLVIIMGCAGSNPGGPSSAVLGTCTITVTMPNLPAPVKTVIKNVTCSACDSAWRNTPNSTRSWKAN